MNNTEPKHDDPNRSAAANLVSVIIPVYNSEQYLVKCLDSLQNQSYRQLEILLINDGSTDKSEDVCRSYVGKDNRFSVITTENSGPAAARNTAMKNARGSLFLFLDADDYLPVNAIEMLVRRYQETKADIVVGDFVKLTDSVQKSGHEAYFPESRLMSKDDLVAYTRSYLQKPNRMPLFVYSWGRLFNAKIIREHNILYNPDLRTFEDVAFNFEYLKYANGLFFLNYVVYNHLVHDNYLSASMAILNNPQKLFGYHYALINARNYLQTSSTGVDIEKEVGHAYICYTIIQLVRLCGQINKHNKKMIYGLVGEIAGSETVRKSLKYYSPSGKDSKVVPVLLRWKLARLTARVCQYKARKRYKSGK